MNNKGYTSIELIVALFVLGFALSLLTGLCFWTDRNIDFWLTQYAHAPRNCPFWLSAIATVVMNGFAILFNVISEIIRLAK